MKKGLMAAGMAFMFLGLLMNSNIVQSKAIDSAMTVDRQQTASAGVVRALTAEIKEGLIAQDRTQTLSIPALGLSGLAALGASILTAIGLGSIASLPVIGAIIAGIVGLGFALGFTVLSGLGIIVPVAAGTGGGLSLLAITIGIGLLIILFPPAAIIAILILGGGAVGIGTVITTVLSAAGAALVFLITAILGAIVATQAGSIIVQVILAAVNVVVDILALVVVGGGTILVDALLLLALNILSIPLYLLALITMPIGCIAWPILMYVDGRIGVLKDVVLSPLSLVVFPLLSSIEHPIEIALGLIVGNIYNVLALPGGIAGAVAGFIGGGLDLLNSLVLSVLTILVAGSGILFTGGMIRTAGFTVEKIVVDIVPDTAQKALNVLVDTLASLIPGVGSFLTSLRDNFLDPAFDATQGTLETIVNVFSGAIMQQAEEIIKLYGLHRLASIAGMIGFLGFILACIGGFCVGIGVICVFLSLTIILAPITVPIGFISAVIGTILFIIGAIPGAIAFVSLKALHDEAIL